MYESMLGANTMLTTMYVFPSASQLGETCQAKNRPQKTQGVSELPNLPKRVKYGDQKRNGVREQRLPRLFFFQNAVVTPIASAPMSNILTAVTMLAQY